MNWRFFLAGFVLLLAFDTAAQLSLKAASTGALPLAISVAWLSRLVHEWTLYGAMFGFIGAFIAWMTLLRRAPIGPAFAASNLDIVTVLVASHWVFGDHIGWTQALGTGLIVAGVACLAFAAGRGAPATDRARPTKNY